MATGKAAPPKRRLKKLFTAEELLSLPVNGRRLELVRGKLYEMAPSGGIHGSVAFNICLRLGSHVESSELGRVFIAEAGYILRRDPDTVRVPDVSFVARGRLPEEEPPEGFLELAPDLVVEVVSPTDRRREVDQKVVEWLNAGTRLVWVIHPTRRTVTVHRPPDTTEELTETATLNGADVIPGFSCRVGDLFA